MSRSVNGKIKKDILYLERRNKKLVARIQTLINMIDVHKTQLMRLQAILKDRQERQGRYNETIKQG